MSRQDDIKLSRRKALASLGAVGVASAGAGVGTSAYFSDQEDFSDNTIQAGEFGVNIEFNEAASSIDQGGIGPDELGDWYNLDENQVMTSLSITDAKPGDTYDPCWDITTEHNPGFVQLEGEEVSDEDGSDADIDPNEISDIAEDSDFESLGESENVTAIVSFGNYDEPADEFTVTTESQEFDGLTALFDALQSGWPLVDDSGDPVQIDPGDVLTLCIKVAISPDAGNELQGASHESNVGFYAEQARHNDEFGN